MGRYLELARQVTFIETSKLTITDRELGQTRYDKNDINDKRSDQRPVLPTDRNQWSTIEWHTYFDERAAFAEYDDGLDKSAAEHRAFECAVVEWLNTHPEPEDDPDVCSHCRGRLTDTDALPVLNGPGGHVWLHPRCHQPFIEQRRGRAFAKLEAVGLLVRPELPNM